MPWLNSSRYLTCQTRKEPSTGWMVNSMSGLLFHSVVRISIFLSSSIEGRGMLELDPGEDALVLPCSPSSPSSPWSEEALSDMSSKSRRQEKYIFFFHYFNRTNTRPTERKDSVVQGCMYQSQTSWGSRQVPAGPQWSGPTAAPRTFSAAP